MTKQYDYLVFIGRFQPFHNGHASVITKALELANKVIVLAGSANRPRYWYNPFTFDERKQTILEWYEAEFVEQKHDLTERMAMRNRLAILPLNDHLYHETAWETEVQTLVTGAIQTDGWRDKTKIGLIGHSKDRTSYYLKKFPQWGDEDVEAYTDRHTISATQVRKSYFQTKAYRNSVDCTDKSFCLPGIIPHLCPDSVCNFLMKHDDSEGFNYVMDEINFNESYQTGHAYALNHPYKPKQITVDGVVIQSGHILVIRRRTQPGVGLLALPGGFLDDEETLFDAVLREIKEETKLRVPPAQLRKSLTKTHYFDDVHRDGRGRIITHAFLFELEPTLELPKVKGNKEETKGAWWMPLSELDPRLFFGDHYFIIKYMLGMC